jgi:cell division protein FtsL
LKKTRATFALTVATLWMAVLASGVGAVYCRYRARQLFIHLEQLSRRRDNLDIQWGQLQLEESAWSTHALVESVAQRKLHMKMPSSADIVVVRP